MSGAALDGGEEIISAINVTPLVDITLVLLIVFMVCTSLMESPVLPIQLPIPKDKEETVVTDPPKTYQFLVDKEGRLFVDNVTKTLEEAKSMLEAEAKVRIEKTKKNDTNVVLSGDGAVKYQSIIGVIDLVRGAGIGNLALNVQFASVVDLGE